MEPYLLFKWAWTPMKDQLSAYPFEAPTQLWEVIPSRSKLVQCINNDRCCQWIHPPPHLECIILKHLVIELSSLRLLSLLIIFLATPIQQKTSTRTAKKRWLWILCYFFSFLLLQELQHKSSTCHTTTIDLYTFHTQVTSCSYT